MATIVAPSTAAPARPNLFNIVHLDGATHRSQGFFRHDTPDRDAVRTFITRWLTHPSWPFVAGGLAIVVALPSLRTGLLVDDYVHRAMFLHLPGFTTDPLDMFGFIKGGAGRVDELRRFALPWWASDDLVLAFWRPVSAASHALDYAFWPDAPWLMHLHSLLWYGGVVLVLSYLFRQILDVCWQAGLAAFAYAVSHTHAMPVFFLANRNALLGLFFGAATLLLHHQWRQQHRRAAAVLAAASLAVGLASNEGAVAACAYLFAYAVFLDKGALRARLLSLTPYVLIVVAWRLFYQLHGYGASASEAYVDPGASPARFLEAVATRVPLYLLAQWFLPPTDFSRIVSPVALTRWWLFACGFLLVLWFVILPLLRREATARFWFTGMVLSLIPSCAVFPMDRMLLHSGIGAAALLAQFVGAVEAGNLAAPNDRVRRILGRGLCTLFIALHLVLSPVWLPIRIVTAADSLEGMTDGIKALAERDDISHKVVVLVADVLESSVYFPAFRALSGREHVGQLLVLAPVSNRFDTVILRRPSENTLVMQVDGNYEWFLMRDRDHPFSAGDTIDLNRVKVEIQQVSDVGRPTKVAFQFDTSLDDESIVWFGRLEPMNSPFPIRGRYPSWKPPAVGRTVSAQ